jgi:mannose-6-phosphate isomerase-like protein (cupin superfamily)
MRPRRLVLSSLLAVGAVNGTFGGTVAAQYAGQSVANRYPQEWENDQFRVRRVAIAPRTQMTAFESPGSDDSVLIFLTADTEGRMPTAEAVFVPRGARPLDNRGTVRFEAISIALKDVPVSRPSGTPPEAFPLTDAADVRILIDNPRVIVLKARYRSNAYSGPLHFHPKDTVVIYLGGGSAWPMNGRWGSTRVRRGDIELVPANTLHTFGNAGSDPLDVLVIAPK